MRELFLVLSIIGLICLGIGMLLSYMYDAIEEYIDEQRREDER